MNDSDFGEMTFEGFHSGDYDVSTYDITLEGLFGNDGVSLNEKIDAHGWIYESDMIQAIDIMSGKMKVICGWEAAKKDVLRLRARGRGEKVDEPSKPFAVLWVGVDFDTDDLQRLTALVQNVKGESPLR